MPGPRLQVMPCAYGVSAMGARLEVFRQVPAVIGLHAWGSVGDVGLSWDCEILANLPTL
jgi:hypothetical protein